MNPELLLRVQNDSKLFLTQVLGVTSLEEYQADICDEVSKYDKIAISACHAVGKTWLMARIALWFLYSFVGRTISSTETIVITTAPTARQVEKLLWGEIGQAVKSSKFNLGGHLTTKELKIGDKWYAMGFSPKKEAGGTDTGGEQKGSTFQGFHADHVLVIFDEAVGIPADIWTQVEGLLTSGKIVKFLCIANPTTKNCDFYKCFSLPSWRKIHLTCFNSPNLIANGITDIEKLEAELELLKGMEEPERLERIKGYLKPVSHLLSCQWVMDKALEWGLTHPLFQSKVLGIFPDVDDTVLIQEKDVKAAQGRKQMAKEGGGRFIGIDVARFGDDRTVFTELVESESARPNTNPLKNGDGPVHTRTKKTAKQDLMATTGHAVNFIMESYEGEKVVVGIDATGVGSGVYDRLVELQKEGEIPKRIRIVELHFGAGIKGIQRNKKPTKREELEQNSFLNIKALMFDDLSKALKNEIRLRNDSTYNQQLPTIKYNFNSTGKMFIESKKDYKKRTGKPSPDEADSLAIANFMRRYNGYGDYLRKLVK